MGMTFTFNGTSSTNNDFELRIATAPTETAGAYAGELIITDGVYGKKFPALNAYGNCTRDYAVSLLDESGGLKQKIGKIRQWLYVFGYKRLTDDYDPDVYRKAACISAVDFDLFKDYFAQTTISFDCDPRRFLISGETPIGCYNGQNILNNYMESKPKLVISSLGAGHVYVGNADICVLGAPGEDIVFDSETMIITNSSGTRNLSPYISISNQFPVLKQGSNTISWNSGITSVTVVPNWWQP